MTNLKIFVVILCVVAAASAEKKKESKKRDAPVVSSETVSAKSAKDKAGYDYTAPSQSGYDAVSGFGGSGGGFDSYSLPPQTSIPSGSYGTPLAPPLNEHTYNGAGGHGGLPEYAALQGTADIHGNDLNSYGSPHGSIGAISVAALTGGNAHQDDSFGHAPSFSFGGDEGSVYPAPSGGTYQTIGYEIADHSVLGGGNSASSHSHGAHGGGPALISATLGNVGGQHLSFGAGGHGNSFSSSFASSGVPSQSYGVPKPWTSPKSGWQSQTSTAYKPWQSQSNVASYGSMSPGWVKLQGGASGQKGWAPGPVRINAPKASYQPAFSSSSISSSYGVPSTSSSHSVSSSYGVPHGSSSFGAGVGGGASKGRPDYSVPAYAQGHKGLKHYSSGANSIGGGSFGGSFGHGVSSSPSFGGHSGSGFSFGGNSHGSGFSGHNQGFSGAHGPSLGLASSSFAGGHGIGSSGGYHGGNSYSGNALSFNSGPQKFHKNVKSVPLSFSSKPLPSSPYGSSYPGASSHVTSSQSFGSGSSHLGSSPSYSSSSSHIGSSPSFGAGSSHIGSSSSHIGSSPSHIGSSPSFGAGSSHVSSYGGLGSGSSYGGSSSGSKTPFKPSAFLGAIGAEEASHGFEYSSTPKHSVSFTSPQKSYLPPASNYLPPAQSYSSSYSSSAPSGPSQSYGGSYGGTGYEGQGHDY